MKLDPRNLFRNPQQQAQQGAQQHGGKLAGKGPKAQPQAQVKTGKTSKANAVENGRIDEDEDAVDTGSGSAPGYKSMSGQQNQQSASSQTPLGNRAHIVNRDALAQAALAGPGSLDPSTLAEPINPDARRWLGKRGVELLIPENWRFLGADARVVSFNSSGDTSGHSVDVSHWRMPGDLPVERLIEGHKERAEEELKLGRLSTWKVLQLGEVLGVLQVGAGPDAGAPLPDAEELYLLTDGTGRRAMTWRGAASKGEDIQLVIVSLHSPIESFADARALYDALLEKVRILK